MSDTRRLNASESKAGVRTPAFGLRIGRFISASDSFFSDAWRTIFLFHDFDDHLLRDSAGRYYLHQCRYMKMPLNAAELYYKKMCELSESDGSDGADDWKLERKRLIAWRRRLTKPHTTIKHITEKTALLWCVHQSGDDYQLKRRLRQAVITMCG